MNAAPDFAENRQQLALALEQLHRYLLLRLDGAELMGPVYEQAPLALQTLAAQLELNEFEQQLLLLAAAAELDPRFPPLLARAHGDEQRPWLSFALATALLPQPDWAATTPVGRLRRWLLLTPSQELYPLTCRLAVDEMVIHQLMGLRYPEPGLQYLVRPLPLAAAMVSDSDLTVAADCWRQAPSLSEAPVIFVQSGDGGSFAQQLAAHLGLNLYRLLPRGLATDGDERNRLMRLWERQALLRNAMLWVASDELEADLEPAVAAFINGIQGLVLISGNRLQPLQRPKFVISGREASVDQRQQQWVQSLGSSAALVNGQLAQLAEQFRLPAATIHQIACRWRATSDDSAAGLWAACRAEARQGLEQLAQRVESNAGWQDLVLPVSAMATLKTIVAQVRQRNRVYRDWGFADAGSRGLGISALFAGGSGTGKTLAAEVIANALQLDLYRIDLSALVSKYIGETEKNLARVFAAAEASGAILLFDEADALFGKRSEVRDSHDRYANLEVSYLLQRIESYRGLAILTSNLKQSMDSAFLRRLRFIVTFPFPDAEARTAIWARVFPAQTPVAGLDLAKLGRLSLSGGHIRNLALNAAFLAADEGRAVAMDHLRIAAEAEFAKLEKPLNAADVGDWL